MARPAFIPIGLDPVFVDLAIGGTMAGMALYYAKKGDSTQALQFIRLSLFRPYINQLIYNVAVVRALANQPEEALEVLKEAFQKGYSPAEARNDPELKILEGRPEF